MGVLRLRRGQLHDHAGRSRSCSARLRRRTRRRCTFARTFSSTRATARRRSSGARPTSTPRTRAATPSTTTRSSTRSWTRRSKPAHFRSSKSGSCPRPSRRGRPRTRTPNTYVLDGGCFYPPRDYDKWAALVTAWATHVKERYPGAESSWQWELWNEPDIALLAGNVRGVRPALRLHRGGAACRVPRCVARRPRRGERGQQLLDASSSSTAPRERTPSPGRRAHAWTW